MSRGQANVVGVALLIGITVVSLGALTASIGAIVESNAAAADADRVASDLDSALEPVAATGPNRGTVSFADGRLQPTERNVTVRVGDENRTVGTDALVFTADDSRAAFHTGGIVRGTGESSFFERPPPITVGDGIVVVGAARLGDPDGVGGTDVRVTLATNVSHERERLGNGPVEVAVETAAPVAWERMFRDQGATTERRSGEPSTVVATYDGNRTGYLVVHDLELEVQSRG